MNSNISTGNNSEPVNDPQTVVDQAFGDELLATEWLRWWALVGLFTLIPIVFVVFKLVVPATFSRIFGDAPVLMSITVVCGLGIAYELGVRWILFPRVGAGKRSFELARIANTVEEVSIPTVGIWLLTYAVDPVAALVSPAAEAYYLFIALSALRLDFRHCLLAGATAALQYMALAAWLLQRSGVQDAGPLSEFVFYLDRAAILFVVGACTALVTWRFRDVIERAVGLVGERNRVVGIFGQHVSPQVVNQLLEQQTQQDGEARDVCIMFLDIRNFTSFSENRSPEQVVEYLNKLFGFMIEIINRNDGIINKFLGDGFMAVFGAPLSQGQDCRNAVRASVEIVERVTQETESGQIPPTRVGIGLHTGRAVTGSIGSHQRKEYTVIGDVVNTASRIEQLNKQFESQILVSEAVWSALDTRPEPVAMHPDVSVKGRAEILQLVQLA